MIPDWAWRALAVIFALSTVMLAVALVAVGWKREMEGE